MTKKPRLTRRQVLGVGIALGSGIALGIVSCKKEGPPATTPYGTGGTVPASETTSATARAPRPRAASAGHTRAATTRQPPPSERGPQPASASATSQTSPETPTTPAAHTTPNLGSEVFPDERGKALAHAEDAPVILVPRTDWTAALPRMGLIAPMNGVNRLTVHHTAGRMTTDEWAPTATQLEGIRGFHAGTRTTDRNWADIGYHFAIDRAGRVWQARPLAYQGAHVRQHNQHNMGIVLLGDFMVQNPTAAQLVALREFIGFVRNLYKLPLDRVYTHRELGDTLCPGEMLQEYMDRARAKWGLAEGAQWHAPASKPGPD